MSTRFTAALLLTCVLSAPTVGAHHSFAAEFDAKNCRDFTGVLTKLDWQNPHAYFYLDVKDEGGTVESWSFQTYALITLRRAGTDRQLFMDHVGKEVFVRGCLARNGRKNSRSSAARSPGSSAAMKWPPRGNSTQRRMSA